MYGVSTYIWLISSVNVGKLYSFLWILWFFVMASEKSDHIIRPTKTTPSIHSHHFNHIYLCLACHVHPAVPVRSELLGLQDSDRTAVHGFWSGGSGLGRHGFGRLQGCLRGSARRLRWGATKKNGWTPKNGGVSKRKPWLQLQWI